MNNGIIYVRVSSKEQIEGTSLASQELSCREYAKSKNITVMKVFVEKGESAKFADRTALLELIEFARAAKGRVQCLLVWKVDRFARVVEDYYSIKGVLLRYGVRILSVTEPITETPEGKLMETILAGFAQFDNDIRAARTVQGMRRKIQEGIFPWGPPLGYRSSTQDGSKKTAPDMPDDQFGVLQKIWREAATGAHTKAEIRRLMTSWGVVTRKAAPLSPQAVDNLFRNHYYAGVLVDPWSEEEFPGKHVPMVSQEEFLRVQHVFAKRSRSLPHQKQRPEFPLRGLVRCPACHRYLTGSFSRGRSQRYGYYHCGNRRCANQGRTSPIQAVHDEFESFLTSIAAKPEPIESIGGAVLRIAEERRTLRKARVAVRTKTISRLNREAAELIRMRAQELITDEEFRRHKAQLDARRFDSEGRQRVEEVEPEELRRDLQEITEPLYNLVETYKALPSGHRRRFEHLVLPAGFENGNVRTAELGLLFRVLGQFSEGESSVGSLVGKSWNRLVQEISALAKLLRSSKDSTGAFEGAVRRNARDRPPLDEMEPELAA